ncbi:MAG: flagellar hook protein FlgE [Candidatus Lambdaproteobacteria bacterium]|nr:flagellar hook protein FlgE [Candidatus Lambdaproteobacteria bacterium]
MNAYGEGMTVVGSNIANVNTVGYKSSRVNFQDMLATQVRGAKQTIGKGVSIASVQGEFTPGSLESSTRITDLAIEGDGFFTLRDEFGRTFYSRAGNFDFDKEGVLVAPSGEKVMVQDINRVTGEIQGFAKQAKMVGLTSPPTATGDGTNNTGVRIAANLNAEVTVPAVPFDPTNVQSEMFNFSTSAIVYDERGGEHVMNIVFRKMADTPQQIDAATGQPIPGSGSRNQWQWYAVFNAGEFQGNPEQLVALGGGFLRFADNGRLLESTNGQFVAAGPGQVGPTGQLIPPGPPQLVRRPLNEGVPVPQIVVPFFETPQTIGLNFGLGSNPFDPTDGRTGLDGITQFAAESKVSKLEADGGKVGNLEGFDITAAGIINGHFDNGAIQPVYRLVLTRFQNNPGLLRQGDNKFAESLTSGRPVVGNPNDGTFGSVRSQNLEKSNVDLSTEFVRMIETQRGFQANAKSITASDEMLADLVAMKR